MNRRGFLAAGAAALALPAGAATASRVLCHGGALTEIVFALGLGHRMIARDTTSSYPPAALALPDVGYLRQLSPEGVLSVGPDLILAEHDAGPVEVVEMLRRAGVPWISVPDGFGPEGVLAKIAVVGRALEAEAAAEALAADSRRTLDKAARRAAAVPEAGRRGVLFILSVQGGRIMAGGADTAADGIIRLAGGRNAAAGIEGYKPMTDEAVLTAAPDLVMMMDRGGDHAILDAELWAMPALATSPAAAREGILRMDGLYLLGFGPRTGQAALDLNAALYAA
jgi:iron complex transport system substrate-binding protein